VAFFHGLNLENMCFVLTGKPFVS